MPLGCPQLTNECTPSLCCPVVLTDIIWSPYVAKMWALGRHASFFSVGSWAIHASPKCCNLHPDGESLFLFAILDLTLKL